MSENVGQHETTRRLGVPVATLGNGCRVQRKGNAKATTGAASAPSTGRRPIREPEAENSRLRKELASAKLDIEIFQKATACFAKGAR